MAKFASYKVPPVMVSTHGSVVLLAMFNPSFQYFYTVSVLHQNEGGIGKFIPDAQAISRDPREISRVEGNLEGRGGGFPNTSLVWMVHGYNDFLKYDLWRFWHFGVKQGSGEENNHCFRESLLGHNAL